MTNQENMRLFALLGQWCSIELIRVLYGLDMDIDSRLVGRCRAWTRSHLNAELEKDDLLNRHALESYLQYDNLISMKRAALSVGMEELQFKEVITRLYQEGELHELFDITDQVISNRIVRDLYKYFESISGRLFSSHSNYCKLLHDAIEREMDITIVPVFDITSQKHPTNEPEYSAFIDHITLKPLGIRYRVWLETKKPLNLRADMCSLEFYANNEEKLEHYLYGSKPEIPEWL